LNEMWFGRGSCLRLEGMVVASPISCEVRTGGGTTKRTSPIETHLLSPMTLQLRKEQVTFDPGSAVFIDSGVLGTCSSFSTSFSLEHMNGWLGNMNYDYHSHYEYCFIPIFVPYTGTTTGETRPPLQILVKLSQANVRFALLSPIQNKNGAVLLTGMIQFWLTTSQILKSFLVICNVTTSLAPFAKVSVFSKARNWMIGVSHGLSEGYCTKTITTSFPATVPVLVTLTEIVNMTSHNAGLPPWSPPATGSGWGVVW
jgi:hypothetical protein